MPNRRKLAPTLYVVDDEAMVREALDSLLRSFGFQVRCFDSSKAFRLHRREPGAACLILDVHMPNQDGLSFQAELSAAGDMLPVVFLTGHGDVPIAVRAMRAGAVEFLLKPFKAEDLVAAVGRALMLHKSGYQDAAEIAGCRTRLDLLTTRERRIVASIVAGRLNKQIAAELCISEITVKVSRARIMRKLQVDSIPALVTLVHRSKLEVAPEAMLRGASLSPTRKTD